MLLENIGILGAGLLLCLQVSVVSSCATPGVSHSLSPQECCYQQAEACGHFIWWTAFPPCSCLVAAASSVLFEQHMVHKERPSCGGQLFEAIMFFFSKILLTGNLAWMQVPKNPVCSFLKSLNQCFNSFAKFFVSGVLSCHCLCQFMKLLFFFLWNHSSVANNPCERPLEMNIMFPDKGAGLFVKQHLSQFPFCKL